MHPVPQDGYDRRSDPYAHELRVTIMEITTGVLAPVAETLAGIRVKKIVDLSSVWQENLIWILVIIPRRLYCPWENRPLEIPLSQEAWSHDGV